MYIYVYAYTVYLYAYTCVYMTWHDQQGLDATDPAKPGEATSRSLNQWLGGAGFRVQGLGLV